MNVKKCIDGHHFDADKYEVCPVCGKCVEQKAQEELSIETKKESGSEKKQKINTIRVSKKFISAIKSLIDGGGQKSIEASDSFAENDAEEKLFETVDEQKREKENIEACIEEQLQTQCSENEYSSRYYEQPQKGDTIGLWSDETDCISRTENIVLKDEVEEDSSKKEDLNSRESLTKKIDNAKDVTIGYFDLARKENDDNVEPVVGWLVCVRGKHFGESFNILTGKNSIGRNSSNKIVISKDNAVSREKHAWIVYEPINRDFYVQAGDSTGLLYLNEKNIITHAKVEPYDKITLGSSDFLFVPFCCEKFSWKEEGKS